VLGNLMKREHRLPLGRALDIAVPLMAAVRTVHAQGIVHRDLKPDNIFITHNEEGQIRPKILDFGFAKMAEPGLQLTGKDTAIGTPNFMSPEQMLSPRSVDPRSDQWALGVLLYFMLTGAKPFKGEKLADTLRNVLQSEPTPLRELCPELPEPIVRAVTRSMRKPPDERFATVHEFAQQLLPFASDAVAFSYATEFYTVSVWEQLGEEPPSAETSSRPSQRSRRARASSPRTGTSSQRAATTSSRPSLPSGPLTRPSGMNVAARTPPRPTPSREMPAAQRPVGACGGAPPGAGKVGARIAPVAARRPEAAAVDRCSRAAERSSAKAPALAGRRAGSVCQAVWSTASTSSEPSVAASRGHAER
jgi:serine/threonine-protein kinase